MYSRSSEPVSFSRDCTVVLVPQGERVTLPAGSVGYITQALGGSFTVFVEGNLFRIAGEDADAIGKEAPEALALSEDAGDDEVEKLVWEQLRTCFDPEIPVNIVDLGLVYSLKVEPLEGSADRHSVVVAMTLTAPGCGMGPVIAEDARNRVLGVPGVNQARVDIVWDPPWTQTMISEDGKMQLGLI